MLLSCDPTDNEAGMKLLEDLTTNASQIQQQVLDQIHKPSIWVAFSIANLIRNISRRKFPLSITKISSHTSSELPMESPHRSYPPNPSLSSSLGTSAGRPKMMPSTTEELDRKTFFYNILVPMMNKYVDGLDKEKGMYLLFIKPEITTPAGLMQGRS